MLARTAAASSLPATRSKRWPWRYDARPLVLGRAAASHSPALQQLILRRCSQPLSLRAPCFVAPVGRHRLFQPPTPTNQVHHASHLKLRGLQCYQGALQHVRDWKEKTALLQEVVDKSRQSKALVESLGIECPMITGCGTGSFQIEGKLGLHGECQAGSYIFMDADYGRNKDEADAYFRDFEHSLFIHTTIMSRAADGSRLVLDAGLKVRCLRAARRPVRHALIAAASLLLCRPLHTVMPCRPYPPLFRPSRGTLGRQCPCCSRPVGFSALTTCVGAAGERMAELLCAAPASHQWHPLLRLLLSPPRCSTTNTGGGDQWRRRAHCHQTCGGQPPAELDGRLQCPAHPRPLRPVRCRPLSRPAAAASA